MMESNPYAFNLVQAPLFELDETEQGYLELFPAVWGAAEGLTALEPAVRLAALERLHAMGAARFSPLIATLIVSTLQDPDLEVRTVAVRIIAAAIGTAGVGGMATETVRQRVVWRLSQMRTRQIFALLEVCAANTEYCLMVAVLLKACPYAGGTLSNILSDRKLPISIRNTAIEITGAVGYTDALTSLERLEARLETRRNGQQMMPFAQPDRFDEVILLPTVQSALVKLRAP